VIDGGCQFFVPCLAFRAIISPHWIRSGHRGDVRSTFSLDMALLLLASPDLNGAGGWRIDQAYETRRSTGFELRRIEDAVTLLGEPHVPSAGYSPGSIGLWDPIPGPLRPEQALSLSS
jgi:hypothetical protein